MFRTVAKAVEFRGAGLHCGLPVAVTVLPAAPGAGLSFAGRGTGGNGVATPARYDRVVETRFRTSLGYHDGGRAGTVEHLLAALWGCGVSDAAMLLDGPEVPALDGSAAGFVRGLIATGFHDTAGMRRAIRVTEPIAARMGERMASLLPAARPEMAFTVEFDEPAIGSQSREMVLTPQAVLDELSDSRTFGLLADVQTLRAMGLARGGNLGNAIVVHRGRILNREGLRHADEFVRHKMLDAVGDLALAGAPIIGRYVGFRAGHEMTNLLLRELFARPSAWHWCEAPADVLPPAIPVAPAHTIRAVPAAV